MTDHPFLIKENIMLKKLAIALAITIGLGAVLSFVFKFVIEND